MTSQIIPVDPFDFIIFGGTGDLSERKLLPALYHRQRDHQFSEPTRIIGGSRSKMSDEEFRAFARKAILEHVQAQYVDEAELKEFLGRLSYVSVDAKSGDGFAKLKKALGHSDVIRVFYLAVAPGLFGDISDKLKEHSLVTPNSRIVVEKPIGRDLASAQALNDLIGDDFGEHQIFRIDHYLGKETVQNLMALRFANALYEPLWNSAHIDHVQITVSETVGLEDRVTYYDKAGALRDMVQNHILQLLCLVAMEAPASMEANAVRDEKLKVLNSLKRINGQEAPRHTVRGQYRAGASAGRPTVGPTGTTIGRRRRGPRRIRGSSRACRGRAKSPRSTPRQSARETARRGEPSDNALPRTSPEFAELQRTTARREVPRDDSAPRCRSSAITAL